MVMMVAPRLPRALLRVLLDRGEIGLCGREIAGLQVWAERLERFGERIGWPSAASSGDSGGLQIARQVFRKCREIGLRLGQIPGLQVLANFLKLTLNLRKRILRTLRNGSLERVTAGNT